MNLFKNKIPEYIRVIDIHNHILPGIDDGSMSIEESLDIAGIAMDNYITDIICTPHYKQYLDSAGPEKVKELVKELQKKLDENSISIRLYPGNEIMYYERMGDKGEFLSMNSSDYLLVEFDPDVSFNKLLNKTINLTRNGYNVILAHTERYFCLLEDMDNVCKLTDEGILIQVNSNSVVRKENRKIFRFVDKLLKNKYVDFVATDAHDTDYRKPNMKACAEYLYQNFDKEYVDEILYLNAERLLVN